MIKSLYIRNFQSHKDTALDLSPLVTAIVGLNNHGKSAVLRAFQKVIRNVPTGNTFITDGEKQCDITLSTDSGKVCRSVKNIAASDANKYTINDKEDYVKFDTEIPAEVLPLMETSLIQKFGDIEVDFNFQPQLEDLFLMQGDGLPSKRGKILGSVTGVDIVNRAIQLCASAIKSAKSSNTRNEQQIIDIDQKLEAYKNLSALSSQVTTLLANKEYYQELSSKLVEHRSILSSLESLVAQAIKATKVVDSIDEKSLVNTLRDVQSLHQKIQVSRLLWSLQTRIQKQDYVIQIAVVPDTSFIENCIRRGKLLQNLYLLSQQITQAYSIIDIAKTISISADRAEKVKEIQKKEQQYTDIYNTLKQIKKKSEGQEQGIFILNGELEKVEQEKKALEQELGVCPLCGRAF
jgi:exonuclease SbcC